MEDKIRKAAATLAEHADISEDTALKLVNNGYVSLEGIISAGQEEILAIDDINEEDVNKIFADTEG